MNKEKDFYSVVEPYSGIGLTEPDNECSNVHDLPYLE